MTTPKKIKREVRERMRITGESYTTARMRVLAEKGITGESFTRAMQVQPKEKNDR